MTRRCRRPCTLSPARAWVTPPLWNLECSCIQEALIPQQVRTGMPLGVGISPYPRSRARVGHSPAPGWRGAIQAPLPRARGAQ